MPNRFTQAAHNYGMLGETLHRVCGSCRRVAAAVLTFASSGKLSKFMLMFNTGEGFTDPYLMLNIGAGFTDPYLMVNTGAGFTDPYLTFNTGAGFTDLLSETAVRPGQIIPIGSGENQGITQE